MVASFIEELAEARGYKTNGRTAYGVEDGIPITIVQDSVISVFAYVPFLENYRQNTLKQELMEEAQELRLIDIVSANHTIEARFSGKVSKTPELIGDYIDALKEKIAKSGTVVRPICAICSKPCEDAQYNIYGQLCYAHDTCAQDSLEAEAGGKKHRFRGLIGAILGAIIGTIPWLILQNAGWFVGALALFVGIMSYKGYEFFGGKLDKAIKWIVLVCSIAAIFVMQFAYLAFEMLITRIPVTMDSLKLIFADAEFTRAFWTDIAVGLIIAIVSIIWVFADIKKKEHEVIIEKIT